VGQPDEAPDPRRWRALGVCLVAGFMVLLDVSIVNVALPSIQRGIGAAPSQLEWIVSGYALAFGLVLVPAGRVADVRGRRPLLVAGLALFTLASAACGFAPSPLWLVAARLIQGVGGGMITPQIAGLIQALFRGAERGTAFGLFGATVGISTAIGPLVGGVLISLFGEDHGWRSIFLVNLPIGVGAILLAFRWVPHVAGRRRGADYDPVGVLLLGAGVVALLLPFVESRTWPGGRKWLLLIPAAVLLVAFVGWERRYGRRGREPMVDLALFRRRSYAFGCALALAYFAGFTGIFFVYSQFLQQGHGYSALEAGLATLPFAVGAAASAGLGGRIVTRVGGILIVAGLVLVAVGVVGLWYALGQVSGGGVGWAAALPLLVAGIGNGMVIAPNQTLTVADVPVRQASTAGGVLQTGQRIGSAAGIAASGTLFYTTLANTRGDFQPAARDAVALITGLVLIALAVSVVDVAVDRRARRTTDRPVEAPAVGQ
jgi:EmrB/QacA subfamily drug resistance transporter